MILKVTVGLQLSPWGEEKKERKNKNLKKKKKENKIIKLETVEKKLAYEDRSQQPPLEQACRREQKGKAGWNQF